MIVVSFSFAQTSADGKQKHFWKHGDVRLNYVVRYFVRDTSDESELNDLHTIDNGIENVSRVEQIIFTESPRARRLLLSEDKSFFSFFLIKVWIVLMISKFPNFSTSALMVSTKKSALSNICTNWQRYFRLSFSTKPLKSWKEDTKEIKRKDNLRNVNISFWDNHNRKVLAEVDFFCSDNKNRAKTFSKDRKYEKKFYFPIDDFFFRWFIHANSKLLQTLALIRWWANQHVRSCKTHTDGLSKPTKWIIAPTQSVR